MAFKAYMDGVNKMKKINKIPFANLSFENWLNLVILTIIVFSTFWWTVNISNHTLLKIFGGDYLAFWSAGKIADKKGYSQIYDLQNLKTAQFNELGKLGLLEKMETSSYLAFPVAILPVFVFPFQLLSKINIELSYWIWTFINLIVVIGYLIYFTKRILPGHLDKVPEKKLLLLMLLSYPVWANFAEGQVNIFLVVCMGEFIRQAINKKPLLSGLWLGGLLLKPQLLVLIIPTLLLMRYWKALSGFIISSFILLMTSFLLSGFVGMKGMIDLWTRFSTGMATNSPEQMINWRMIGVNINLLFNASFGGAIAFFGMVLTILLVYIWIKGKPAFGSPAWIITMAAVLSASLAVTWHSHYHMAIVVIPFLIYAYQFELISKKIVFAWATTTIVLFLIFLVVSIFILVITKTTMPGLEYLVAISGFFVNFLIFFAFLRYLHSNAKTPEPLVVDFPIS